LAGFLSLRVLLFWWHRDGEHQKPPLRGGFDPPPAGIEQGTGMKKEQAGVKTSKRDKCILP